MRYHHGGGASAVEASTPAIRSSPSDLQSIGSSESASMPLTALCPHPPPPPPPPLPPISHAPSEGENGKLDHDPTAWTTPVGANGRGWFVPGGAYMPHMTPEQQAWHMWAAHQHHMWYMQNVLACQQQAVGVKKKGGSLRKRRVTTRMHNKNSRSTSNAHQGRKAEHTSATRLEEEECGPSKGKHACLTPSNEEHACADAFFTNEEEEEAQTDEDSYAVSEASTVRRVFAINGVKLWYTKMSVCCYLLCDMALFYMICCKVCVVGE
jgi:hypothetical protein